MEFIICSDRGGRCGSFPLSETYTLMKSFISDLRLSYRAIHPFTRARPLIKSTMTQGDWSIKSTDDPRAFRYLPLKFTSSQSFYCYYKVMQYNLLVRFCHSRLSCQHGDLQIARFFLLV